MYEHGILQRAVPKRALTKGQGVMSEGNKDRSRLLVSGDEKVWVVFTFVLLVTMESAFSTVCGWDCNLLILSQVMGWIDH